ncbi:MAG: hypothetical protein IJ993_08935, partial [Akkermansia sp.]|nr:hypothetical protein [Akkermansia sp.]
FNVFSLNSRGLRPCLLAAALTGSIIRLTRKRIFHVRPQGRNSRARCTTIARYVNCRPLARAILPVIAL